ncbi:MULTISPECIES: Rrf2 family transcriptional regulator [Bacillaceae]|jgi:Rrf2 family protein|uniref:Rrf2 family transcriptional regulator n=1 Tax=Bacillaceae TaxID=186817 RepID=UPI0006ADA60B|nr:MULTISPECIES: Rrf2 family transcriptional regulator [Bacillaceae]ALC87247.1 Rrf2 family transcriptional regulator [Bacillus sp. FJAT-22090]KQL34643.1 Rrf2 family transcriptional regulator [Psychrobacillus sp. FJAT-21963]MDF2067394.1 Rrf2 family transcriptional regulator [Bacillus sp. Cr_A10]
MKISSRFTVAVHILSLINYDRNVICTSEWIAESVNTNPVVIRRVMGKLKNAGLIDIRRGLGGATLQKPLQEITLLDVYRAVDVVDEGELFQMHENPNPNCPVGANIQGVLELILFRAQDAMEAVLKEVTMEELVNVLNQKIG